MSYGNVLFTSDTVACPCSFAEVANEDNLHKESSFIICYACGCRLVFYAYRR